MAFKQPLQSKPSVIPTSLGDGTRSVRFKHIHRICVERIQQVQQTYFLWNPKKETSDTPALPNFECAIKHVIDALAAEEMTQFDRTKRFRGLQPWMLTRKYVVHKVAAWHHMNVSPWMKSTERLYLFKKHYLPTIETYLASWILTEHQQDLHGQAQLIWDHIVKEYISPCDDGRDWFLQYKITERRIIDMAERLCKVKTVVLHSIFPVNIDGPHELIKKLERKLAKVIQTIQYEVLPFSKDIEDVVETLKHHFWDFWISPVIHLVDINETWLREALDDLNDEGDLLDYYNQAFIVHVNAPTKSLSGQAYGSGEDISLCSTVDYTGMEHEGFLWDPSLCSAAKSSFFQQEVIVLEDDDLEVIEIDDDDDGDLAASVQPFQRREAWMASASKEARSKTIPKLEEGAQHLKFEQEVIEIDDDDDVAATEKPIQKQEKRIASDVAKIQACSTMIADFISTSSEVEATSNDYMHSYLLSLVCGHGSRRHLAALSKKSLENH